MADKTIADTLEEILLQVRKPARYLGNEWNAKKKDLTVQAVKFAICFPDLYEIGMSHLGLRIIYGLLNSLDSTACERVFLPDLDMQAVMKSKGIPLFSLETKAKVCDFDFLGFCLNYELDYTNVLGVLELAGIPFYAKDRGSEFPLIIAGGCSAANPEPLADFVDLFLVGEAEEALVEIVEKYKAVLRRAPKNKEEILLELAKIEGVYVPSFYDAKYDDNGRFQGLIPRRPDIPYKIKKRIVRDLDRAYYPVDWLVPYAQVVHDRAAIELMRGCPHRCNFCQARSFYQNVRMRSPEKVTEIIEKIRESSGYEELSLLSLSSSDYPYLRQVIDSVGDKLLEKAVAISFPSLRPKSYLGAMTEYMAKVHKTTLTFAPEAGSERMRQAISKDFDVEELYEAALCAFKSGWQAVKLYFMCGLPKEASEDLDGILAIAARISQLRKEVAQYPADVTVSISFFIPKPHTFFEREIMQPLEALREKEAYLRKKAREFSRRIRLNFHDPRVSMVEAVFSRGDRRLGDVLLAAYKSGCMLDGWPEHFSLERWTEAFDRCGIESAGYLRERTQDEKLPWGHIDLSA